MIKLIEPYITSEDIEAVYKTLRSGNLTQGEVSINFENSVKEYIGSSYAFSVSSATTGLHLALVAGGIGPGDEVIIPDFTFPATANAVIQSGAAPVLVDIDLSTLNINVDLLESKINKKTKAIMVVHAFGLCCDMDSIKKIADSYNLLIIEDAACALGSKINSKHAGTFGHMGVFSFHPRKIITTGEGGMIVTQDDHLAKRISILRTHGSIKEGGKLNFIDAGFNYRLSDINASLGLSQMQRLEEILSRRIELSSIYDNYLQNNKFITKTVIPKNYIHSYQSYVVRLDNKISRDLIVKDLRVLGIETTLGTYSLSSQPYFSLSGFNTSDLIFSKIAQETTLTLPLSHKMQPEQIIYIVDNLNRLVLEQISGKS